MVLANAFVGGDDTVNRSAIKIRCETPCMPGY
jgi:hypothetical protein